MAKGEIRIPEGQNIPKGYRYSHMTVINGKIYMICVPVK